MKRVLSIFICLIMVLTLMPVSNAAFEGEDKIVIAIDPGHGGVNVGTARNGIGEKVMTFKLGNLLKEKLEANGNFVVHMTRTGDYDLPLAARGIYANTVNADLLVSLHFDGSTSGYDRGVSVITSVLPEYEMTKLAGMVCNSLSAKTGLPIKGIIQRKDNAGYYWNTEKQWDCQDPSLGILSDYYGIPTWCSKFGIGSILIEHGFFTNAGDAAIIFADGAIEKMAEADAEAIINYYTNHDHVYSAATQDFPSNCMFQGKSSEKCTVCGHRRNITNLEAAPDNHYWINEKSQAASCGTDGYVSRQCWITLNLNKKDVPCENHEETTYIKAEPHNYVQTDSREVTHSVDGFYQYTCSKCNHTYKETVKAEGHTWKLTDEINPNCTKAGKKTYSCDVCKESYDEAIPALGHSISIIDQKAQTCTEDGYIKSTCTACGESLEETLSATGHDMKVEVLSQNSCTVDGETHSICNTCGYEETVVTPKTGHNMELTEEKKATCEESGYSLYICSACGLEEKTEAIATGHNFITEITAEASLFTQGAKLSSCANCGEQYREVIPSAWDNPATKAVAVGGTALIAAAIFTIILFYMKRKNKAEEEKDNVESDEKSDAEMAAAAEEIAKEAVAEETSKPEAEAEASDTEEKTDDAEAEKTTAE